jgi:hypothetical protein
MVLTEKPQALDRDLLPLRVGDHVRFIARGFFFPREQESFGTIESIDECGGVKIKTVAGYKQFLSSKKIGDIADVIYFTHHHYDAEKHARVYSVTEGKHELFLARFEGFPENAAR